MDNNQEKHKRLRSLCYSELKRFKNCPKEFWLRYNRVGEESVTVETPEAIIGEIVHRVASGQDHPRRVKKLLEKFQDKGILIADNLVELEKQCQSQIKTARSLKTLDASTKTRSEKKFKYDHTFTNREGVVVDITLVAKPDRIGHFEEKGKTIPEIAELKTTDKPHSSHLKQLLFAALVYSRHRYLDRWLSVAVKLVLNYAPKPDAATGAKNGPGATETRFASQYRLEEFLKNEIEPAIEEINRRMKTEDFPANVTGRCRNCPFAVQCDEYQASFTEQPIQGGQSQS